MASPTLPPPLNSSLVGAEGGHCLLVRLFESRSGGAGAGAGGQRLLTLSPDPPGRAAPTRPDSSPPMPRLPHDAELSALAAASAALVVEAAASEGRGEDPRSHRSPGLGGKSGDSFKPSPAAERVLRLPHLSRFKLFPVSLLSPSNPPSDFQPLLPLIFLKVFGPPQ